MEDKEYDAMKLPVRNNAIPGTLPRPVSFYQTYLRPNLTILIVGSGAVVSTAFLAITDHAYALQARKIHNTYEAYGPRKEIGDSTRPLTIHEELNVLRERGHKPKSWAIDLFKKAGVDNYLTPEGFEQKK